MSRVLMSAIPALLPFGSVKLYGSSGVVSRDTIDNLVDDL